MAWVLKARNPDGNFVALKVLKDSRVDTGQVRFRREFRALARMNHPNVIRVDSYGDIFGHPYIAMEFVDGRDLHKVIRGFRRLGAPQRWRSCEGILVDLCRALAHIHRHGLVHRDLKPSNVLLDQHQRAKLTDFGIVKDLDPDRDPNVSNTLVGTWAYASPEQICGEPVDHRSDLYSLGVILFTMLTGRRPFVAKGLAEYLELHRDHRAPRPGDLVPGVPPLLEDICVRLLCKRPRDRFQSAQEILFRLEKTDTLRQVRSRPAASWEPPFVGQEAPLATILDSINALTSGQGGVLWITGPLGSGRTRLLEAALSHARELGFPVHKVRARAADGALGSLARFSRQVARDLGANVPQGLEKALDAFVDPRQGTLQPGNTRYRLYDLLRLALRRALIHGPRVLAVDDLHMAGVVLLDLLAFLARAMVAEGLPLLVVGTARSDGESMVLPGLGGFQELGFEPGLVELEPLGLGDLMDLLAALLGNAQGTRALAERLHRETEGNPLFVTEFLQTLLERRVIVKGPGGWALAIDTDEVRSGHLEIPAGIRSVLGERLAAVGQAQKSVLDVLAVNGRELDLDVLLEVLELDEDSVLDHLDRLVTQGILVERRAGVLLYLDFSHGKFGDIIYRDMQSAQRAELHGRLARIYESMHGGSVSRQIGEHYRRAGDTGNAFKHLVVAAEALFRRSAPAEAWELLERAGACEDQARTELEDSTFKSLRLRILNIKAEILYGRGSWESARGIQEEALVMAGSMALYHEAVRARLRLASSEFRLGNEDHARELREIALAEARRLPNRELVAEALHGLAASAWARGDLEACSRLSNEGLVLAVGSRMQGQRAELLLARTAVQASNGDLATAIRDLSEAESIFDRLGRKRARCLALTNLAETRTWKGNLAMALSDAVLARQLAAEVLYRLGEGIASRVEGSVELELGRLEEARVHLGNALDILLPLKVNDELVAVRYALGRVELEAGNLHQAEHHLSIARGVATKRDPEGYLSLVLAALSQVLLEKGSGYQAEQLLGRAIRTATESGAASWNAVTMPRQVQSQVLAAMVLEQMGRSEKACQVARAAVEQAKSRGLLLWALDASALLERCTADGENASRLHRQTVGLRNRIVSQLPEDLIPSFLARPSLVGFGR